jgi:hypothetical protein
LLAKWQSSASVEERAKLAMEIQALLTATAPAKKDSPDSAIYRQLTSLGGPLFSRIMRSSGRESAPSNQSRLTSAATESVGLDPAQFGKHPNGSTIDAASLCVQAPSVIEIRLPADLVAGYEFVTTGVLDKTTGAEGSVQLQLLTNRPSANSGLLTIEAKTADGEGPWYSNNRVTSHNTPIVVNDGSAARKRIKAAFDEFRQMFPAALCYTKIVPVDEVVTLTLYYREDDHFKRLMLDDARAAQLDRL